MHAQWATAERPACRQGRVTSAGAGRSNRSPPPPPRPAKAAVRRGVWCGSSCTLPHKPRTNHDACSSRTSSGTPAQYPHPPTRARPPPVARPRRLSARPDGGVEGGLPPAAAAAARGQGCTAARPRPRLCVGCRQQLAHGSRACDSPATHPRPLGCGRLQGELRRPAVFTFALGHTPTPWSLDPSSTVGVGEGLHVDPLCLQCV